MEICFLIFMFLECIIECIFIVMCLLFKLATGVKLAIHHHVGFGVIWGIFIFIRCGFFAYSVSIMKHYIHQNSHLKDDVTHKSF